MPFGIRKRRPAAPAAAQRRRPSPTMMGIQQSIAQQSQQLLTTGRRMERFDQLRQRHFFSSCVFAASAQGYIQGSQSLFITPPGQNGQGFPSGVALTEGDTNWKSANRVPDNQNFEITELGLRLRPMPTNVVDSQNTVRNGLVQNAFFQNSVVSITYLTNSVPLGKGSDFAPASGPFGGSYKTTDDGASTVAGIVGGNGFVAPALRRKLKIPILLQHGETFSFQIDIPRAVYVGAMSLMATLDFWATESFAEKS